MLRPPRRRWTRSNWPRWLSPRATLTHCSTPSLRLPEAQSRSSTAKVKRRQAARKVLLEVRPNQVKPTQQLATTNPDLNQDGSRRPGLRVQPKHRLQQQQLTSQIRRNGAASPKSGSATTSTTTTVHRRQNFRRLKLKRSSSLCRNRSCQVSLHNLLFVFSTIMYNSRVVSISTDLSGLKNSSINIDVIQIKQTELILVQLSYHELL